jgi:hypothetical protein
VQLRFSDARFSFPFPFSDSGAERLDFTHLWRSRHVGDTLHAVVLRDGQRCDVSFTVAPPRPLVPILHTVDCFPSYYVVGGLVFLPLSVPFLEHGYGASWRKVTPVKLQALLAEYRTAPDEEVVLLFQILSAELNYGYKGTSLWVTSFNGVKLRNLAQMAALVEVGTFARARARAVHASILPISHFSDSLSFARPPAQSATGPWLEWETDDGSCIVLDRAEAVANSGVILSQHAIANDRSADLREASAAAAAAAGGGMDWDAGGAAKGGGSGGGPGGGAGGGGGAGAPPQPPAAPEETPPPPPPAPGGDASDNSPPPPGGGGGGGEAAAALHAAALHAAALTAALTADDAAAAAAAVAAALAAPPLEQIETLAVPETIFGSSAGAAAAAIIGGGESQLSAPPPLSQSVRPGDPCGDFGAPPPKPQAQAQAQAQAARGGFTSPLPVFAPRRPHAAFARAGSGGMEPMPGTAPF